MRCPTISAWERPMSVQPEGFTVVTTASRQSSSAAPAGGRTTITASVIESRILVT